MDIKKAFDRVARKMTEWAMKKKDSIEVVVRAVISLYQGAKMTGEVGSELFEEYLHQVGVYQGSVLLPLR